ncbi:MAG: hypothetical protein MRK01_15990 [Candidatus Scalindua sp.]|nr:hypothetical protein [Candidatus Scalindua sp.]
MKTCKGIKSISLTACIFLLFSIFTTLEAFAAEYYIDPVSGKDSDTGLSQALAWATISYAMEQLSAGDTLFLMDGTFTESLNITISGKPGDPITFKALNDGKVIIDGKNSRIPLLIEGTDANHKTYIDVEGIVCRNSNSDIVQIKRSDNISIKRVSAYNADPDGNFVAFSIAYDCTNILVEDCAASGTGRKQYNAFSDSKVTFRRCWGRWIDHQWGNWNSCLDIYGADDCIVENCIVTMDSTVTKKVHGIEIVNQSNPDADRNKIYGNIVYGINDYGYIVASAGGHHIRDNKHVDNVAIMEGNSKGGFLLKADGNWTGDRLTLVGTSDVDLVRVEANPFGEDPDFQIRGVLRNSVLLSGDVGIKITSSPLIKSFTNKYNNLCSLAIPYSGRASQGAGEAAIKDTIPSFDTVKYGKGAYLIRPANLKGKGENGADIGAEILYQYIDGILHRDDHHRLWPWQMEDRIFAETGVSVTWEAKGGIWKTLNGVYPEN